MCTMNNLIVTTYYIQHAYPACLLLIINYYKAGLINSKRHAQDPKHTQTRTQQSSRICRMKFQLLLLLSFALWYVESSIVRLQSKRGPSSFQTDAGSNINGDAHPIEAVHEELARLRRDAGDPTYKKFPLNDTNTRGLVHYSGNDSKVCEWKECIECSGLVENVLYMYVQDQLTYSKCFSSSFIGQTAGQLLGMG